MAKKADFNCQQHFFAYQQAFFVENPGIDSSFFFEHEMLRKNFSKLYKILNVNTF